MKIAGKSLEGDLHAGEHAASSIGHAAGTVIDSLGRHWNPDLHPRDARGRFIETGGVARLNTGAEARVLRTLGGGWVQVATGDGVRHNVFHDQLTMVSRPNGEHPTNVLDHVHTEDESRLAHPFRGNGTTHEDHGHDAAAPAPLGTSPTHPVAAAAHNEPVPPASSTPGPPSPVADPAQHAARIEQARFARLQRSTEGPNRVPAVAEATARAQKARGELRDHWLSNAEQAQHVDDLKRQVDDMTAAVNEDGHAGHQIESPLAKARDAIRGGEAAVAEQHISDAVREIRAENAVRTGAAARRNATPKLIREARSQVESEQAAASVAHPVWQHRADRLSSRMETGEHYNPEAAHALQDAIRAYRDGDHNGGDRLLSEAERLNDAARTHHETERATPTNAVEKAIAAADGDGPKTLDTAISDARAALQRAARDDKPFGHVYRDLDRRLSHSAKGDAERHADAQSVADRAHAMADSLAEDAHRLGRSDDQSTRDVAEGYQGTADRIRKIGDDLRSHLDTMRGDERRDAHNAVDTAKGPSDAEHRADRGAVLAAESADRVREDHQPGEVLPGHADQGARGNRHAGERDRAQRSGADQSDGADRGAAAGDGQAQGAGDRAGRGTVPAAGAVRHGEAGGSQGGRSPGVAPGGDAWRPSAQGELSHGNKKQRAAYNIAALKVLKTLEDENRPATEDERKVLARWGSWGALAAIFDPNDHKWDAERAELSKLLTPDEMIAARATTMNAHYTDAGIVDRMWSAMTDIGFDGGDVLEPGSGIGTFIGMAPDGARMQGVELDPVTARLAQKLYPNAGIMQSGFENVDVPEASFDAAIGNVPFATTPFVSDGVPRGMVLHDGFIYKAMRGVRPGGIGMFLTSAGTMDKKNSKARQEIAKHSDLIGAVRLPGGAHQAAADTPVVTDLLMFRRRAEGEEQGGLDWIGTTPITAPDGGDLTINKAFATHPDRILGELNSDSNMYGEGPGMGVHLADIKDLPDLLRRTLRNQVTDAKNRGEGYKDTSRLDHTPVTLAKKADRSLDGHITAHPDGTFSIIENGVEKELPVAKGRQTEVRDLLKIRDIREALLAEERSAKEDDTPKMRQLRKDLNKAYDAYVAKYKGPIQRLKRTESKTVIDPRTGEPKVNYSRGRPPILALDRRGSLLLDALEDYNRETNTAGKAAIFNQRVLRRAKPIDNAGSPDEALSIALAENPGEVHLGRVAGLLGLPSAAEARTALGSLVFDDPETGKIVDRESYLGGDVRSKLAAAIAAAEHDPSFAANVTELKRRQPADLRPDEISVRPGAPWLPEETLTQYARERFNSPQAVVRNPGGGSGWTVDVPVGSRNEFEAGEQWGVKDNSNWSAGTIFQKVIQQSPIVITHTDPATKKSYVDRDQTKRAQTIAKAMLADFREWLWSDPERTTEMARRYNEMANFLADIDYTGREVSLPGLSDVYTPYEHQHAGIVRGLNQPTMLLAHEVGFGKSLIMHALGMKLRELGLANKPAHVVPNHMVEQYSREMLEAFPGAKILIADKKALNGSGAAATKAKREAFVARAASGDWDAVVFSHSAFELIPMSPEAQEAYLDKELAVMRRELDARLEAGEKQGSRGVKQVEKQLANYEAKVRSRIQTQRDKGGISFEDTGIDYMFVDEAHLFKNLMTQSRIDGASIAGSQRASDIHMKLDHLRETRGPSARISTFATATPVSNSMTEVFTMQRFLQPELLKKTGMESFDRWAAMFGEVVAKSEVDVTGQNFKSKSRFRKFTNIPEMLKMFRNVADVRLDRAPGMIIPKVRGGSPKTILVEPSPEQVATFAHIGERAKAIEGGNVDPSEDNLLKLSSDGRKAALDMRLLGGVGAESPKLEAAADQITSIWQRERGTQYRVGKTNNVHPVTGSLQVAFLDLGTPKELSPPVVNKLEPTITRLQVEAEAGRLDRLDAAKQIRELIGKRKVDDVLALADNLGVDISDYDEDTTKGEVLSDVVDALLPDGGEPRLLEVVDYDPAHPPWSAYQELKDQLIRRGIPADKIAFIHDAKDDAQKAEMFKRAREGGMAVLIGSTGKMGVGTNVQDRIVALHHLDVPWRPADLAQRDGRAIRQGNQNDSVDIYNYATKGSFDSFMWQGVARKASFINAAMRGDTSIREMEDLSSEELQASQISAAINGNPWQLRKVAADADLSDLMDEEKDFQRSVRQARESIASYEQAAAVAKKSAAELHDSAAKATDINGDNFAATIGGKAHDKRKEADEALKAKLVDLIRSHVRAGGGFSGDATKVGEIGGVDIMARPGMDTEGRGYAKLALKGDIFGGSMYLSNLDKEGASSPITSLEYRHRNLDQYAKQAEDAAKAALANADRAESASSRRFAKENQLERAQEQVHLIDEAIALQAGGGEDTEGQLAYLEAELARSGGGKPSGTGLVEVEPEIPLPPNELPAAGPVRLTEAHADRRARADAWKGEAQRLVDDIAENGQITDPAEIQAAVERQVRLTHGADEVSDDEIASLVRKRLKAHARARSTDDLKKVVVPKSKAKDYLADPKAAAADAARTDAESAAMRSANETMGDAARAATKATEDGKTATAEAEPSQPREVRDAAHAVGEPQGAPQASGYLDSTEATSQDLADAVKPAERETPTAPDAVDDTPDPVADMEAAAETATPSEAPAPAAAGGGVEPPKPPATAQQSGPWPSEPQRIAARDAGVEDIADRPSVADLNYNQLVAEKNALTQAAEHLADNPDGARALTLVKNRLQAVEADMKRRDKQDAKGIHHLPDGWQISGLDVENGEGHIHDAAGNVIGDLTATVGPDGMVWRPQPTGRTEQWKRGYPNPFAAATALKSAWEAHLERQRLAAEKNKAEPAGAASAAGEAAQAVEKPAEAAATAAEGATEAAKLTPDQLRLANDLSWERNHGNPVVEEAMRRVNAGEPLTADQAWALADAYGALQDAQDAAYRDEGDRTSRNEAAKAGRAADALQALGQRLDAADGKRGQTPADAAPADAAPAAQAPSTPTAKSAKDVLDRWRSGDLAAVGGNMDPEQRQRWADTARLNADRIKRAYLSDDGHFLYAKNPGDSGGWKAWHAATGVGLGPTFRDREEAAAFVKGMGAAKAADGSPFDWASPNVKDRLAGITPKPADLLTSIRDAREARERGDLPEPTTEPALEPDVALRQAVTISNDLATPVADWPQHEQQILDAIKQAGLSPDDARGMTVKVDRYPPNGRTGGYDAATDTVHVTPDQIGDGYTLLHELGHRDSARAGMDHAAYDTPERVRAEEMHADTFAREHGANPDAEAAVAHAREHYEHGVADAATAAEPTAPATRLADIGQREHPNVKIQRSGGIGHLPGDESHSATGFVNPRDLIPYRLHAGDQQGEGLGPDTRDRKIIDQIKRDIESGHGIESPVRLDWDATRNWGELGEGNHRLQAALEAGAETIPVTVLGRSRLGQGDSKPEDYTGAPLHGPSDWTDTDGTVVHGYEPPHAHPDHFDIAGDGATKATFVADRVEQIAREHPPTVEATPENGAEVKPTPEVEKAAEAAAETVAGDGVWSRKIGIDTETPGGPFVNGTAQGDPAELRAALKRNRAFSWDPTNQRWRYTGKPADQGEALAHLRSVLADLDKREAEAPAAADGNDLPVEDYPPTPEQQLAIDAVADGKNVVIRALAGTGKTSTLLAIARRHKNKKILYLAFNRSIKDEAAAKFPKHVKVSTSDGLAFVALGSAHKGRILNGLRRPNDVADVLGQHSSMTGYTHTLSRTEATVAALATLRNWMISSDDAMSVKHIDPKFAGDAKLTPQILDLARKAWADAVSPDGQILFTHEHSMKMWALKHPILPYDMVFLDEAQDTNDVLAGLVAAQRAQQIVVGDSNQSIYQFRGASDQLDKWEAEADLPLTQSWRFGPAVADIGNRFLQLIGSPLRVQGNPGKGSTIGHVENPDAILTRTNAGAVGAIADALEQGKRVASVGDAKEIKAFAKAAGDLQSGRHTSHPELSQFKTWSELEEYAQETNDGGLQTLIRLVNSHGSKGLLDMLERLVPERGDEKPDVTISTAHKAKGREWPSVQVWSDFKGPEEDAKTGEMKMPSDEEMRLNYVAVTRAEDHLDPGGLDWVFAHTNENGGPAAGTAARADDTGMPDDAERAARLRDLADTIDNSTQPDADLAAKLRDDAEKIDKPTTEPSQPATVAARAAEKAPGTLPDGALARIEAATTTDELTSIEKSLVRDWANSPKPQRDDRDTIHDVINARWRELTGAKKPEKTPEDFLRDHVEIIPVGRKPQTDAPDVHATQNEMWQKVMDGMTDAELRDARPQVAQAMTDAVGADKAMYQRRLDAIDTEMQRRASSAVENAARAEAPAPSDEIRDGEVGMKFAPGEVVRTVSGRTTTPFPDFGDMSTDRKVRNGLAKVDAWLLENAKAEAAARDLATWSLPDSPKNMTQAEKDTAEMILFDKTFHDNERDLPRPHGLKPLNPTVEATQADAVPAAEPAPMLGATARAGKKMSQKQNTTFNHANAADLPYIESRGAVIYGPDDKVFINRDAHMLAVQHADGVTDLHEVDGNGKIRATGQIPAGRDMPAGFVAADGPSAWVGRAPAPDPSEDGDDATALYNRSRRSAERMADAPSARDAALAHLDERQGTPKLLHQWEMDHPLAQYDANTEHVLARIEDPTTREFVADRAAQIREQVAQVGEQADADFQARIAAAGTDKDALSAAYYGEKGKGGYAGIQKDETYTVQASQAANDIIESAREEADRTGLDGQTVADALEDITGLDQPVLYKRNYVRPWNRDAERPANAAQSRAFDSMAAAEVAAGAGAPSVNRPKGSWDPARYLTEQQANRDLINGVTPAEPAPVAERVNAPAVEANTPDVAGADGRAVLDRYFHGGETPTYGEIPKLTTDELRELGEHEQSKPRGPGGKDSWVISRVNNELAKRGEPEIDYFNPDERAELDAAHASDRARLKSAADNSVTEAATKRGKYTGDTLNEIPVTWDGSSSLHDRDAQGYDGENFTAVLPASDLVKGMRVRGVGYPPNPKGTTLSRLMDGHVASFTTKVDADHIASSHGRANFFDVNLVDDEGKPIGHLTMLSPGSPVAVHHDDAPAAVREPSVEPSAGSEPEAHVDEPLAEAEAQQDEIAAAPEPQDAPAPEPAPESAPEPTPAPEAPTSASEPPTPTAAEAQTQQDENAAASEWLDNWIENNPEPKRPTSRERIDAEKARRRAEQDKRSTEARERAERRQNGDRPVEPPEPAKPTVTPGPDPVTAHVFPDGFLLSPDPHIPSRAGHAAPALDEMWDLADQPASYNVVMANGARFNDVRVGHTPAGWPALTDEDGNVIHDLSDEHRYGRLASIEVAKGYIDIAGPAHPARELNDGTRVQTTEDDGNGGRRAVEGILEGVDENDHALIRDDDGNLHETDSTDVHPMWVIGDHNSPHEKTLKAPQQRRSGYGDHRRVLPHHKNRNWPGNGGGGFPNGMPGSGLGGLHMPKGLKIPKVTGASGGGSGHGAAHHPSKGSAHKPASRALAHHALQGHIAKHGSLPNVGDLSIPATPAARSAASDFIGRNPNAATFAASQLSRPAALSHAGDRAVTDMPVAALRPGDLVHPAGGGAPMEVLRTVAGSDNGTPGRFVQMATGKPDRNTGLPGNTVRFFPRTSTPSVPVDTQRAHQVDSGAFIPAAQPAFSFAAPPVSGLTPSVAGSVGNGQQVTFPDANVPGRMVHGTAVNPSITPQGLVSLPVTQGDGTVVTHLLRPDSPVRVAGTAKPGAASAPEHNLPAFGNLPSGSTLNAPTVSAANGPDGTGALEPSPQSIAGQAAAAQGDAANQGQRLLKQVLPQLDSAKRPQQQAAQDVRSALAHADGGRFTPAAVALEHAAETAGVPAAKAGRIAAAAGAFRRAAHAQQVAAGASRPTTVARPGEDRGVAAANVARAAAVNPSDLTGPGGTPAGGVAPEGQQIAAGLVGAVHDGNPRFVVPAPAGDGFLVTGSDVPGVPRSMVTPDGSVFFQPPMLPAATGSAEPLRMVRMPDATVAGLLARHLPHGGGNGGGAGLAAVIAPAAAAGLAASAPGGAANATGGAAPVAGTAGPVGEATPGTAATPAARGTAAGAGGGRARVGQNGSGATPADQQPSSAAAGGGAAQPHRAPHGAAAAAAAATGPTAGSTTGAQAPSPEWVKLNGLGSGDTARIEGADLDGNPVAMSGYVTGAPTPIQDQQGRQRVAVTLTDTTGAGGGTVLVDPAGIVVRAQNAGTPAAGAPQSLPSAQVLSGNIADQQPLDAAGRGVFPGSTVTAPSRGEGTVVATGAGVGVGVARVQWGVGSSERVPANTLAVSDDGASRPPGWTLQGEKVKAGQFVQAGATRGTVHEVDDDTVSVLTPTGIQQISAGQVAVLGAVGQSAGH